MWMLEWGAPVAGCEAEAVQELLAMGVQESVNGTPKVTLAFTRLEMRSTSF